MRIYVSNVFYASKIRIHDIHKITNHKEKLKSVCLIITLKMYSCVHQYNKGMAALF